MGTPPDSPPLTPYRSAPLRIVLIYAAAGAVWILLSDLLLERLVTDRATLVQIETLKGWFFVAATAAVLYRLISRSLSELQQSRQTADESDEGFRLLVEGVKEYAVFLLDPEGRVTSWNSGARLIKGYEAGEIIGHHFSCFYTDRDLKEGKPDQELSQAAASGSISDEGWRVRRDGSRFWASVTITALRDPDGKLRGFAKVTRDMTERRQSEMLLAGQKSILEMIASGAELHVTLDALIHFMERESEDALCSVLLLDEDDRLRFGAAPSLPDEYNSAVEGQKIGPSAGSCGTALFRREMVVVTDIASDPLWDGWRELALRHGLKACTSVPIIGKSGVPLGAFAFYYHTPTRPSAYDLELIKASSALAGIAIDHEHYERQAINYNKEQLTLNRIVTTCTGSLDLKEILEKVLDEALVITGLEGGTICLLNDDDTLHLAAHRQTSADTIEDLTTHDIKIGDCLCGTSARDQQPLILRNRTEVLDFSTREATRNEQIFFHAAFPFVTGGKCVGVLCVFTRTAKTPPERSLKLLETVTAQVSLAIENARLYEETLRHATILEEKVQERTAELEQQSSELERMNRLFVGRELRMKELKERIAFLEETGQGHRP